MYIASYYAKNGSRLMGLSDAQETREAAAKQLFSKYPNAADVSTCHAYRDDDGWKPNHCDVRWHRRELRKVTFTEQERAELEAKRKQIATTGFKIKRKNGTYILVDEDKFNPWKPMLDYGTYDDALVCAWRAWEFKTGQRMTVDLG